jgi:hypothetical protein
VRPAAVLGALAAELARPVGLHAQHVRAAGDHVELAGERRHPEAVDHVGGLERELDRPSHRDADLVRGLELGVAHAPPPLLAGHLDAQRGLGRGLERIHAQKAVDEKRAQHDDRERDAAAQDENLC